uniref:Uncharacterized protein n=1 Tax=Arundo donax TaxID=35708 RepID=A0A0A9AVP6_ARUDO
MSLSTNSFINHQHGIFVPEHMMANNNLVDGYPLSFISNNNHQGYHTC